MFDIGFTELMLLALIGLLVLGPERLPRLARTLGGYTRKAREAWHNLKIQVESELDDLDHDGEMRQQVRAARDDLRQAGEKAGKARQMLNQPVTGTRELLSQSEPESEPGSSADPASPSDQKTPTDD